MLTIFDAAWMGHDPLVGENFCLKSESVLFCTFVDLDPENK